MRDKYGRFIDSDPYAPKLVHEAGIFHVFSRTGFDGAVYMTVSDVSYSGGFLEFFQGPGALQRAVAYAQEKYWTHVFELDL
jgi:hypothetical protein